MEERRVLHATEYAMQIAVYKNLEEASQRVASILVEEVRRKPDAIICVAAGQSPTRTYHHLADAARDEKDLFQEARILKLDEWIGPSIDDNYTCEHYIQTNLIRPLGLRARRYVAFQSDHPEPVDECVRIRKWIELKGPIDICLLGIGQNGHVGLNEPGTEANQVSHIARLTDATLAHSMLSDTDFELNRGFTVGLAEILSSRRIHLLVFGSDKAAVLQKMMSSKATPEFPASYLVTHEGAVCHCDEAAAALIHQDGKRDQRFSTKD